jgi:hypothetical protein
MRPTLPSGPSSIPSYRRCATCIVFLTPKRSFLNASCCSLEVMKGGTGLRRRSLGWTF